MSQRSNLIVRPNYLWIQSRTNCSAEIPTLYCVRRYFPGGQTWYQSWHCFFKWTPGYERCAYTVITPDYKFLQAAHIYHVLFCFFFLPVVLRIYMSPLTPERSEKGCFRMMSSQCSMAETLVRRQSFGFRGGKSTHLEVPPSGNGRTILSSLGLWASFFLSSPEHIRIRLFLLFSCFISIFIT